VVDQAVRSAARAGAGWWALGGEERARLLVAAADRLSAAAYDLAVLESLEMGKPVSMAQEDVEGSVEMFRAAAEAAATFFAPATPAGGGLRRRPYGVAALVTPWNYPVCQVTDILGGLLAAGNTVVVKPSEKAPLSVAALGPLLDVLPPGVVNIVLGDGAAGAALVEHPLVGLVHFTGSVATGRRVGAAAGARLVPCFLELGGKDALVVDRDVDVAKAAELENGPQDDGSGQAKMAEAEIKAGEAEHDMALKEKEFQRDTQLKYLEMGLRREESQNTLALQAQDMAQKREMQRVEQARMAAAAASPAGPNAPTTARV
jgi:hypothetical protein